MFHPLPLYVGLRYVRARSYSFFVSFITWASLLGVGVGVAALIVILSVMNGFESELRDRLLSLGAQVRVTEAAAAADGAARAWPPPDWHSAMRLVRGAAGVVGVAPYAELQALAVRQPEMWPVVLRGIDPQAPDSVRELAHAITQGALAQLTAGSGRIIVGAVIAERLGLTAGDSLTMLIPSVGADGTPAPKLREFSVMGVFITQGLVIGWLGVALGVGLGLELALHVETIVPFLERTFRFQILDADVYYITAIPAEVHWGNVVVIAALALALTALATVYPAVRAARTAPAEARRPGRGPLRRELVRARQWAAARRREGARRAARGGAQRHGTRAARHLRQPRRSQGRLLRRDTRQRAGARARRARRRYGGADRARGHGHAHRGRAAPAPLPGGGPHSLRHVRVRSGPRAHSHGGRGAPVPARRGRHGAAARAHRSAQSPRHSAPRRARARRPRLLRHRLDPGSCQLLPLHRDHEVDDVRHPADDRRGGRLQHRRHAGHDREGEADRHRDPAHLRRRTAQRTADLRRAGRADRACGHGARCGTRHAARGQPRVARGRARASARHAVPRRARVLHERSARVRRGRRRAQGVRRGLRAVRARDRLSGVARRPHRAGAGSAA